MLKVRGMQDTHGHLMENFNFIVNQARKITTSYGCFELQPPVVEFASLFERNLGDESDVVKKEIYKFEDRGGEILALRPEFTASIVRSLLENKFKIPCKIFSHGPLFRYDRPQKGRYRQFHQVNFESFGNGGWLEDCETILLANNFLASLALDGGFILELNSLGSKETLMNYKVALIEYFSINKTKLSALSCERLAKNPIRILDSKEDDDVEICQNAPKISSFYSVKEKEDFLKLQNALSSFGVKFTINERIVRGLDYYTGIVFEFITSSLGSQGTILGGGRYDNLVGEMGGSPTPAIGFAAGIERLSMLIKNDIRVERVVFILPISEAFELDSLQITEKLRGLGIKSVIFNNGQNIGKRLEKISKQEFENFALVMGEKEKVEGVFKLKNLTTGEEFMGNFEFLISCLKLQ